MNAKLKHSPLCSRDGGCELFFTVKKDAAKFRVTVPRNMLDDACGQAATEASRKAWAKANMPTMLQIVETRPNTVNQPPFNQILVEEIS